MIKFLFRTFFIYLITAKATAHFFDNGNWSYYVAFVGIFMIVDAVMHWSFQHKIVLELRAGEKK